MKAVSPLAVSIATAIVAVVCNGQIAGAVVWNHQGADETPGQRSKLIAAFEGPKSARSEVTDAGTTARMSNSDLDALLAAIEKKFFLHDFERDTIDERIVRLEKFTFGATQAGTPQQRLARINATLKTHSASQHLSDVIDLDSKVVVAPNSANPNTLLDGKGHGKNPAKGADDSTDYPHISYLEDEILEKTYPGQSLETRLARMETKAFGTPSQNKDLSDRTDALEQYAERKLHKRAFEPPAYESAMDDAGIAPPSGVPAAFKDTSDNPFGFTTPKTARRHSFSSFPEESDSNPAALQDSPPDPGDRLLNRVAWCEMHTFGRTYPDMHLLKRLRQLNDELFPNDKEKDFQLMDHVDAIVKEVVLRQHPHHK